MLARQTTDAAPLVRKVLLACCTRLERQQTHGNLARQARGPAAGAFLCMLRLLHHPAMPLPPLTCSATLPGHLANIATSAKARWVLQQQWQRQEQQMII